MALLQPAFGLPGGLRCTDHKRFNVYRNNVTVGLVRALEANFPAVRTLLGDVYFSGLAKEFVRLQPPEDPRMFLYGTGLPDFLSACEDLADYPYLADVARIEILMRESHHARDCAVLEAARLASFAPEDLGHLTFIPHPATRLATVEHGAASITRASRQGGEHPVTFAREGLLVTRPLYDVVLTELRPSQFEFCNTLCRGAPLAEAANLAAEDVDIASLLATCLSAGVFASVKEM